MLCKAGGLRDTEEGSAVGHARIRTKFTSPSLPVSQDALRAAHQGAEPLCIHRMASPLRGYRVYTLTPRPLNNPKFSMFSISTASCLKVVCLYIALLTFT